MKLKTVTIFLAIFAAFLFPMACGKKGEKGHEVAKGPAIKVSIARVEKGDVPQYSESVGTVKAEREATVASKVMGSVARLNFREGDRIREGAVLVEIDDRDIAAQLAQAQAAVLEASAAYKNAEINLSRINSLFEQKSATQQQVDNASMQFDMSRARTQQAHANVESLKVMMSYTKVSAPFTGVITEKSIEKGEMTAPGRALFRITDDRNLRFETEVRETEIKGINVGKVLNVRVDAIGQVIKGKVSRIIPSGDPATHSFLVKIDLPATVGLLSGMFGRAYLEKGVARTLLVPRAAVIDRGQLTGVFVIKDNTAAYRMIRTGMTGGEKVEVLSGLTEGEEVAVTGLEKLSDGSQVEIVR